MRAFLCVVVLAFSGLLGGCATATRGTYDVLVVESDPPGARVTVSTGASGSTPGTFSLRRKGDYVVTISKDGYETVTVDVKHKVVPAGSAGMAGNLLLGGLIGAAVDAGSGAMFDLVPNPIKVNLVALSTTAPPAATNGSSASPVAAPAPSRKPITAEDRRAAAATLEEMRALSQALIRYRQANGKLPDGKTIVDVYPALARMQPVRIADHWGNPFAFGVTPEGFVLASAGADGLFDDSAWTVAGEQSDLAMDAVVRIDGDNVVFVRRWIP